MQDILILGAGKSATILIESLLEDAVARNWFVHVADVQEEMAASKIHGHERAAAYGINLENDDQLTRLIRAADIVISMLPPSLHFHVAKKCVHLQKHFLNASYITPELQSLDEEAKAQGITMLCEMGLDPGIDHMSAMEMIDGIRADGGEITGFRSHCGGLISPESDNNPWHYKISWNPKNIVLAGKDGARYLEHGKTCYVDYAELFDPLRTVTIPGMGNWAWYPNRDSLHYIDTYQLNGISSFVRTTLRHPDFCHGWQKLVALGMTNEENIHDTSVMTLKGYLLKHLETNPSVDIADKLTMEQFSFLGLLRDDKLNIGKASSAAIIQHILEQKLSLSPGDKDMIIMLHEIEYELNGKPQQKNAHLVVKGIDQSHTAMAKTVGLPLAIAAENILNGKVTRRGVFIPVYPDIYHIVLPELERKGLSFTYTY
jgi:saccharopine dehydrogenase (NADP+, L-glutamate forming)